MAVTLTSDFKIDEELLYTMFLNRVLGLSSIFNARSNGAIVLDQKFQKGFTPKESQMDETENLITRQDITSVSDATDLKIAESQTGGVKRFFNLGPVLVTQNAIREKEYTEQDMYNFIATMAAKQVIENARSQALALVVALIGKTAALTKQTKTTFKPTDILEAITFYGENRDLWALTLMPIKAHNAGLLQAYSDKADSLPLLAVSQGKLYGLGVPILQIKDSALDVADADDVMAGDQAGSKILFLPRNSVRITTSVLPRIVTQLVTGKEQLALRFQAEYSQVFRAKQHEWVGTDSNPTDSQFKTSASWTSRAKSNVAGVGFSIEVTDA